MISESTEQPETKESIDFQIQQILKAMKYLSEKLEDLLSKIEDETERETKKLSLFEQLNL